MVGVVNVQVLYCKYKLIPLSCCLHFSYKDIIREQSKELRGTQRQITRDRAALEKQEKQMVGIHANTLTHGQKLEEALVSAGKAFSLDFYILHQSSIKTPLISIITTPYAYYIHFAQLGIEPDWLIGVNE